MFYLIISPLKSWLSENLTQAYVFLGANFGFSMLPLVSVAENGFMKNATSFFQLLTAVIAFLTGLLLLWGRWEHHRDSMQMKQDMKNKNKRANEKANK